MVANRGRCSEPRKDGDEGGPETPGLGSRAGKGPPFLTLTAHQGASWRSRLNCNQVLRGRHSALDGELLFWRIHTEGSGFEKTFEEKAKTLALRNSGRDDLHALGDASLLRATYGGDTGIPDLASPSYGKPFLCGRGSEGCPPPTPRNPRAFCHPLSVRPPPTSTLAVQQFLFAPSSSSGYRVNR